jgi:CRISPR/Cas system endoribonuclease Cas6 (RAMP superfamily)
MDAGDKFDTWVDCNLEQEAINLQTRTMHVEKRPITGFIGQVAYHLHGQDLRWLSYMHLLADLAFWTGAGYQTTRGMGQVRRISN